MMRALEVDRRTVQRLVGQAMLDPDHDYDSCMQRISSHPISDRDRYYGDHGSQQLSLSARLHFTVYEIDVPALYLFDHPRNIFIIVSQSLVWQSTLMCPGKLHEVLRD